MIAVIGCRRTRLILIFDTGSPHMSCQPSDGQKCNWPLLMLVHVTVSICSVVAAENLEETS